MKISKKLSIFKLITTKFYEEQKIDRIDIGTISIISNNVLEVKSVTLSRWHFIGSNNEITHYLCVIIFFFATSV